MNPECQHRMKVLLNLIGHGLVGLFFALIFILLIVGWLAVITPANAYELSVDTSKYDCESVDITFPGNLLEPDFAFYSCSAGSGPGSSDPGTAIWRPNPETIVGNPATITNRLYLPGCANTPNSGGSCKSSGSLTCGVTYCTRMVTPPAIAVKSDYGSVTTARAEAGETYGGGFKLTITDDPLVMPSPKPNCNTEASYPGMSWVEYGYYQEYLKGLENQPYPYDIHKSKCKLQTDRQWYICLRRTNCNGKPARLQINRVGE